MHPRFYTEHHCREDWRAAFVRAVRANGAVVVPISEKACVVRYPDGKYIVVV